MSQTRRSFADKWQSNKQAAFAATLDENSEIFRWILQRNGFESGAALRAYLDDKRRVLDAGCGNGRVTALLRAWSDPARTELVAIDLAAADVARTNLAGLPKIHVAAANLLEDLSALGTFDFIYCQEVLHHTGDPAAAFANLCGILTPGRPSEIAIYVYKVKAPVREYVDDFLRARLKDMPYEEAIEVGRAIAELGRALSEVKGEVAIPAIEPLGIEAGRYTVQRFLYHFFMKCFWNDELSFEDNAVINYDWYHPEWATRHTVEEVRGWFAANRLEVVHEHVDHYGITMRGRRSPA